MSMMKRKGNRDLEGQWLQWQRAINTEKEGDR